MNNKTTVVIAILHLAICASAFGGMRAINISSGSKTLDERYVPYGCAELVGVECLMYQGNGSLSMTVDRTMGEVINHVDYNTHYGTNIELVLMSKYNDYNITEVLRDAHFCATNTYVASRVDDFNTIRIVNDYIRLSQNDSKISTTVPYTNLNVSVSRWTENYHHIEGSTNVVITPEAMDFTLSFRGQNSELQLSIHKSQQYDFFLTNREYYVDHVVTNRWSEGVSKTWTKNVLGNAQLTNGMYLGYFDEPLHVFKGDVIKCTSPITSNNPGRVRAILKDDSYGTQSPFLNEE